MKSKLSYQEMKKIVHEICEEEKKINNLDVDVNPITIIEYYTSDVFLKILKITKNPVIVSKMPLYAGGFCPSKGDFVVVFLNNVKRIKKIERQVFRLAEVCYHELRHQEQKKFDKYSYENFLDSIEDFDRDAYLAEHHKYSFEIGAHRYSISKAKNYLKNKYPELYEREKEYIEALEKKHEFYYKTYDASDTIERTIQKIKRKLKQHRATTISGLDKISPVLEIFLNSDMSYKKIDEIIRHEKFRILDKRIVYAFLSSKTFLENINIEELSDEELNLLSESLQYTSILYQNQFKWLEQEKSINLKAFLKIEKSLLKKYTLIDNYYTIKIKHKLNFKRSDKKKEAHMESVPEYLEKTNELIKKRKISGYLVINYFYIIGAILSVLTISYLLIRG